MRAITVSAVWLFLPLTAFAESVAVLPVTYTVYRTNSQDEDRAAKVKEAVVEGVENAELTPMTGEDIDRESRAFSSLSRPYCDGSDCPKKVAERVGADLGVVVSVSDHDGQFDIHIYTTYAQPITASPFGTFNSILKRITAMVRDSLREAVANMPSGPAPPPSEQAATSEPRDETPKAAEENPSTQDVEEKAPPEPVLEKRKRPVKPPAFWSVFGATLALGLGAGSIETYGWVYWHVKKDEAPPHRKVDGLRALQIAEMALWGGAGAGLVTTTILAFFTDFGRTKSGDVDENEVFNNLNGRGGSRESRRSRVDARRGVGQLRLLPVFGAGAGGLVIEGAF